MAVYTHLSNETIARVVAEDYAIGTLAFAVGIAEGVENSNYLVTTLHDGQEERYILTLYEKRVRRDDLPFFMALMRHLHAKGIACPLPIARRDGGVIGEIGGKPSAMVSFLQGQSRTLPEIAQVAEVGLMAARMHMAVGDFSGRRANALSLEGWQGLFAKTQARLDAISPGLRALVEEELAYLAPRWPQGLPRGVVHADMFPDNVFFDGDRLSGVIDFYFACEDMFAYDLAIVMNAWCFDGEGRRDFNAAKASALMERYQAERALSAAEKEAFAVLVRGAALRFLLTRAHDWLFQERNAMVIPHDPMEYRRKLEFHRGLGDRGIYCL